MMAQIDGQISVYDLLGGRSDRITQSEIDQCLCAGSYSGSAKRIAGFFSREADWEKRAEFLKEEYGTGGKYPAFCLEDPENEIEMTYGTPGIRLKYIRSRGRNEILLTWKKAARIISRLIDSGAYAEQEEDDEEMDADGV